MVGAGRARRKLLLKHLAEAEATATGELLGERIRQHVTVDIAGGAAFLARRQ